MLIDKLNPRKRKPHYNAEKIYGYQLAFKDLFKDETSTFSFALGMVCFGIILVVGLTLVVIFL